MPTQEQPKEDGRRSEHRKQPVAPSRMDFGEPGYLAGLRKGKPERQVTIWDTKQTGLCLLHSPGRSDKAEATVTFRAVYYLRSEPGKPKYVKLGRYGDRQSAYTDLTGERRFLDCTSIKAVRQRAAAIRESAGHGNDPKRPSLPDTFDEVVPRFIEQHASKKRSGADTARLLNVYVLPEWGARKIEEIEKSDVSVLIAKISAGKIKVTSQRIRDGKASSNPKKRKYIGTPSVANAVLARLSKLFNWWVAKHGSDKFRSPIVKDMKEADAVSVRARHLSGEEIRALWKACSEFPVYGAAVQCALLTAQRFYKVGKEMRRSDIKDSITIDGRFVDDEWIPELRIDNVWDPGRDDDPDNKLVSIVLLSDMARNIIDKVPIVDGDSRDYRDYVFSLDGKKPLNGWSKFKRRLDKRMLFHLQEQARERGEDPKAVQLRPWQKRDLRRTAKTIMMNNGVRREISEHCLGHKIAGVEGVYARGDYIADKKRAFDILAKWVERTVNPPDTTNVVSINTGKASRGSRRRRVAEAASAT